MRLRLATKFSWSILGIVALSIVSSGVAWYAAWRVNRRLDLNARQALPDVRVEEMKTLFHERCNLIALRLLDGGNSAWQGRLDQLHDRFHKWLAAAHQGSSVPTEEEQLLQKLQSAWNTLDARQAEIFSLQKKGDLPAAKSILLNDVDGRLATEVDDLSDQLIGVNDSLLRAAIVRADWRIRVATWVVLASGALSLSLGGLLLWMLFYRVLFPLRGIVADVQVLRTDVGGQNQRADVDELHLMGDYLRNLMSDTRTRLERSRDRLLAAEKLASVGRLAAGVAHEIRNPLTAIKMWLFSAQEAAQGDVELRRKLEIVSEEIGRLESIVRHFLEFSRPPAIDLRPQKPDEIVEQTLELLRPRLTEAKIEIDYAPHGPLPEVMADGGQLKQVLINLMENAIDAMPSGGTLRVAPVLERDAEGESAVVVRISDTGQGMAEEVRTHVFEPFFTTKDSGTGLGLCIAAQVMARHGGSLVLESSTEKGTTFAVWLRLAEEDRHDKDSRR